MNTALWIVQGILALGFVYSGGMKALRFEQAGKAWPWAKEVPRGLVAFIGIAELVGAAGLVVPQATNVAPEWTPIAAIALGAVVVLGAAFHVRRGEYKEIGVNLVFLVLAVFVAIGRL